MYSIINRRKLYRFILWNSSEFEREISSGLSLMIGTAPENLSLILNLNDLEPDYDPKLRQFLYFYKSKFIFYLSYIAL